MAALSIQVPYPVFYDRSGQPLDNGNIYIGDANLDPITNPIATYYDEALSIPASQPLKTSNGYIYRNGTPAQIYVDATNFSIAVNDSNNTLVYSFPDGTGIGTGAADIEYDPPFPGAVTSGYTVSDKLSQTVSPMDFGAVGDGVTDDRLALKAALESGHPVDGGGYTYGIDGSCSPSSMIGLSNANLVQIGDRSASNAQTLNIVGISDFFVRDVTINMGSGITTLYSDDGNSGLYIGGSDYLTFIENFRVNNVTVTGNGCGSGIQIRHSKRFFVDGCLVHDRVSGSSPDPTNDSQNGIQLVNCANFTLSNSQCYNLQTRLSGSPTLKWTRGFLFAEVRDCAIVGCDSTTVDQGFDFSGAYVSANNYIGNRRWVISACTANACGTYGFKFANVTRDGLVSGCIANNTATIAFVFAAGSTTLPVGLEKYYTQNIDVVGCKVVNVLGTGWGGAGATGFRMMENAASATYPRAIRLRDCHVADTQDTPTTLVGYASDVTQIYPTTTDYNKNIANTMTSCTADASVATFNGNPANIGPTICQVTASAVQSISNTTWTTLNWNQNTYDPNGLHNTVTTNDNIFVKTPGWYRLTALVNFTANATGSRQIRFLHQGNVIDRSTAVGAGSASADTVLVSNILIYANSGDNLRVEAYQGSGGALNVKSNESHFSIELVGG